MKSAEYALPGLLSYLSVTHIKLKDVEDPCPVCHADDEESQLGKEHVEVQVEAPARLILSAKDEQWIEKMVAHYSSKAS